LLTTGVLAALRDNLNLGSDVLVFLLVTVVVALVGGSGPALASAVVAATLLNYYFTPPLRTFSIDDPNNALLLAVFVLVAILVSSAVDLAARRTSEASKAAAETSALAGIDRVRTALLAAVGHDLRTPLAAAKAAVSTLRSTDLQLDARDQQDLVATADESLDQLAALIDDLLDMSRLQAGAIAVTMRAVALEEVIASALDDLGASADAVVLDLAPDLPDVETDPGLLERVIVNLVTNALRFSAPEAPPAITAAVDRADVLVRVVDHGPGIPAGDRDRVFLPFQRLGDTDNTRGVGLGLALSRGFVEAMHGTLDPTDTLGGGLTMELRLPAARTAGEPARPGMRERAGGDSP
jgi:two-component system sensor histidine kinase KdpD